MLWDSRSVQTNNQQRGDASLLLPLFFLTRSSHSIWPQTPGQGRGLALRLCWSLKMLAGLVEQQLTCCSGHDEDSTVQAEKTKTMWIHNTESSECFRLTLSKASCIVWWKRRLAPLRHPLFTHLPPSLPYSLSLKDPSAPWRRRLRSTGTQTWTVEALLKIFDRSCVFHLNVANICKNVNRSTFAYSWGHDNII